MYKQQKYKPSSRMRVFLLAALILLPVKLAWSEEDKILVLDASGSMWGQIEGKTKIEIAREVLKDVIKDWPNDTNAGLIAYGHRRKGDCTDIEVVFPVGPLDTATFGKVVDKLTPRGKTPLSDAVRLGANELKFTEQKATVVLISDGKETCDADPCALGLELDRLGIDFTTHVVGFDVASIDDQQGLRCLAKNTGGDFYSVSNDEELSEALRKATNTEQSADYPAVALNAPIEVKIGSMFSVDILAKEGLDGRVKLFAIDKPEAIGYQRIQKSKDRGYKAALLRAPETAGEYILKFITPDDKQELTSRAIQVVDSDIELEADNATLISSTIDVTLIAAPNHKGRIALYKKGDATPYSHLSLSTDNNGNYKTVTLNTPSQPGEYLLKLESPKGEVLAEKPLSIEPADIAIDVPKSAPMATKITATILAPNGLHGRLQLHPSGQNIALDSQRISAAKDDGYNPIDFQLPVIAGDYEIRFMSLSNDVVAKTSIVAIEFDIGLTMPANANTKEVVIITPFGPGGLLGNVRLETEAGEISGAAQSIEQASEAEYKPLKFKIPSQAGAYFFRFYTLRDELILEEQITVTD